jgi:hypothetical protein
MALRRSPSIRFRTIALNELHGVTFFMATGSLYEIYPHRSNKSCAISTLERLTRIRGVVWLYTPISPKDPVLFFAMRKTDEGLNVLVSIISLP